MIAEKMTGEKSRDYMNARRVAKEYEAITRGLDRAFLSLPPCGSIEEIKQVIYFLFFLGNCRISAYSSRGNYSFLKVENVEIFI